jgi:hypothetical protein
MLDSVGSFAPDAFGYDLDGHRLGRAARMIRLTTTLLAALVLQLFGFFFNPSLESGFPLLLLFFII